VNAQIDTNLAAAPAVHRIARRPRVGFVGLGWIGRKRLDAVATEIEVAALADADPDRLYEASAAYSDAAASNDFEQMLSEDLDAVVIATPNGLHAPQAIACLEQDIAVFCQKPVATTLRDVEAIVSSARRRDRALGVDFCYRHVAGMHELRRRLLDGAIGEIVGIDLTFHNAYGPNQSWCRNRALAGGGCLMDLGVHLIDLALWLQGMPPMERVRSRLFSRGAPVEGHGHALEDLAYAEFIQANGAMVRLACSWHAHIGRPALIEVALTGTRGGALWNNVDGSFYDFDLQLFRGTNCERLGSHPDDWGPRSLQQWLAQLQIDAGFDEAAENYIRSAALIEEVYRA
jgi:predicted dehydrogenase